MIEKFWKWFTKQQLVLRKIAEGDYDLIDDILAKLRKIQKGLAVEFENDGDTIIMTISADGVADNFPIVEEIIAQAPQIRKWKFIAFRQPVPRDKIDQISITVNVDGDDVDLDPKNLKFLPIIDDGNLYVQIFFKDLNEDNKDGLAYGCLMLLDNLIGEYACVIKIQGYEFYNLSEAKKFKNDLIPLVEIRNFLDDYYK